MRQKQLENPVETCEEGYRNFNLKPLTEEEERFIKKLVDTPKPDKFPRGQRRKLQLYGDKGERES